LKETIEWRVLRYLVEQDWPVTTEMVADALKISWNTAQVHLFKLVTEGLVKGKRVGRQNQWIITQRGRGKVGSESRAKTT
jgi:predicted ArsR family transcriptional regulator